MHNVKTSDIRKFAAEHDLKYTVAERAIRHSMRYALAVHYPGIHAEGEVALITRPEVDAIPKMMGTVLARFERSNRIGDEDLIVEVVTLDDGCQIHWRSYSPMAAFGPDWKHLSDMAKVTAKPDKFSSYENEMEAERERLLPLAQKAREALLSAYGASPSLDKTFFMLSNRYALDEVALTARHLIDDSTEWNTQAYLELTNSYARHFRPLHPNDEVAAHPQFIFENDFFRSEPTWRPENLMGDVVRRSRDYGLGEPRGHIVKASADGAEETLDVSTAFGPDAEHLERLGRFVRQSHHDDDRPDDWENVYREVREHRDITLHAASGAAKALDEVYGGAIPFSGLQEYGYFTGGDAVSAEIALMARHLIGKSKHFEQWMYDHLTVPYRRHIGVVHPDDGPVPRDVVR